VGGVIEAWGCWGWFTVVACDGGRSLGSGFVGVGVRGSVLWCLFLELAVPFGEEGLLIGLEAVDVVGCEVCQGVGVWRLGPGLPGAVDTGDDVGEIGVTVSLR